MVDGSIKFDTGIETEGFERDSRTLKEAADACARSVEDAGKRVYDAFNKSSKVSALESQISQTESKIQSLATEMERIGATQVPTEEYRILTNMVEKADEKLASLIARQTKMETTGIQKNSKAWKNLQYDIDLTSRRARDYEAELQELVDRERAFTSGIQTDAYQKKAARLAELNEKLYVQKQKLAEVIRKENEAAEASDKHSKALKKEGKEAQRTGKKMTMLGMIGRSILISFAMRAVSAIGNAIKEGYQNLAQYSDVVNVSLSGLMSSLLYLKNSFVAAFSPVLNYAIPVLNSMIDAIANAISWIGQLFAAVTGKTTFVKAKKTQEDYAASLKKTGSAAAKAGKDAERSTASFDKLNVISEQGTTGGGSGGGSTTDPAEMFETVNMNSEVQSAVDYAKGYFLDFLSWMGTTFHPLLQQSVVTADYIMTGLFNSFDMVCSDIWTLVLEPFFTSMSTMGIPMLIDFATEFIATLEPLFNLAQDLFNRIWRDAAAPALELLGQIWSDCVTILYDAWQQYGVPIFESVRSVIEQTSEVLNEVWDQYVKPVFDTFMGVVDQLWEGHLKPLAERFVEVCFKAYQVLVEFWQGAVLPFVKWFADNFGPIIRDGLEVAGVAFGTLGAFIAGIIESAFVVLEGFLDFLHIGFTQGWDKAWQNVGDIFRNVFNGIVQIAENAINFIVDSLNELSFDVPDWVPKIGGMTFGFDLDHVRLPRLASGTVVPPRAGEFAAILGDNNREAEVVSPISAMKQAFKEAMSEMQGGDGETRIILTLDGRILFEEVVKRNWQAKKQTGKNPLLV